MKTQLVSIKDKTEVRVVMEEDNTVLEDVVVTGIFKKTKESYTGAVSTISKDEIMAFRGQNMLQTLRNIDPAFNVMENNEFGSDPNRLPDITVRGNSSLSSNLEEFNAGNKNNLNTPLIIMDGFEISLTKLMDYNDEEIESINILKDAAAIGDEVEIFGKHIPVTELAEQLGTIPYEVLTGISFRVKRVYYKE